MGRGLWWEPLRRPRGPRGRCGQQLRGPFRANADLVAADTRERLRCGQLTECLQRVGDLDICRPMYGDEEFKCPKCQARYKVVRMGSGGQVIDQLIHCKICKQPLAPTHDGKILKYFLVKRPSAKVP